MFDTNFIFGVNFGNTEGTTKEHAEWSLEAMNEELKEQENIDNYYALECADAGFLATCEAELTAIAAATTEAAGKTGEEAETIFRKYGLDSEYAMEAAKDVLARGAYMGSAKIKAMIAAIVKYISSLITFTATTNKGFKTAKKLIKKQRDAIRKKQGSKKVTDDKFVRNIVDKLDDSKLRVFVKDKAIDTYESASEATAALELAKSLGEQELALKINDSYAKTGKAETINEARRDALDNIKEVKETCMNKEEYEKSTLITEIMNRLETANTICEKGSKDKNLKKFEKAKAKISKLTNESNIKKLFKDKASTPVKVGDESITLNNGEYSTMIQNAISIISAASTVYKAEMKLALQWVDTVLTDAKAVEAMMS